MLSYNFIWQTVPTVKPSAGEKTPSVAPTDRFVKLQSMTTNRIYFERKEIT
jgi:hypothetical protein